MEILDISGCNRFITNEGIIELAKLPNLVQLNMSLLRNVNDEGVQALVARGKLQVRLTSELMIYSFVESFSSSLRSDHRREHYTARKRSARFVFYANLISKLYFCRIFVDSTFPIVHK